MRELPPQEFLEDCVETPSPVKTNGELAKALKVAKADLEKCNIDKRSLRMWAKEP